MTNLRLRRPVVIFHSDDWGLTGIRNVEVYNLLKNDSLLNGQDEWDSYSLETSDDLSHLFTVLASHRDSIGRHPVFVGNFVLTNVDFPLIQQNNFDTLYLKALKDGIPEPWERSQLYRTYVKAISEGLFYPGLHGITHFCVASVRAILSHQGDKRRDLLTGLYRLGVSHLHAKTPWLGYEYYPDNTGHPWLPLGEQQRVVKDAVSLFEQTFGCKPLATCPPGYMANLDTFNVWKECNFHVVHHGSGIAAGPYKDSFGLINLHRYVSFEPAWQHEKSLALALERTREAFSRGWPAVVCMHSINVQSSLVNYRDRTLRLLERYLIELKKDYPDLLFVHDGDFRSIFETGSYTWQGQEIRVQRETSLAISPFTKNYLFKKFK